MSQDHQRRLLAQFFEQGIPLHVWLGLKVEDLAEGRCLVRVPFRPEMVGDTSRPALHGGIATTLADAAGGLAVFTRLGPEDRTSTVDLRMDFLRRGRPEEDLWCSAQVLRLGNRVAVADCEVWQGEPRRTIGKARAVYNVVQAPTEL